MLFGLEEQPHWIEKSLIERGLGLMVLSDLKWVTQVEKAKKTARAIVAQIARTFSI